MWFLRKPRKLLLVVLTGALVWVIISYLVSRFHGGGSQGNPYEITDLSQYDEPLSDNFALKFVSERVELTDKIEKSKLEEAIHREEKRNLIKHEYLKQEMENVDNADELRLDENNDINSHTPSIHIQRLFFTTPLQFKPLHNNQELLSSLVSPSMVLQQTREKDQDGGEGVNKYGHNETVSRTISLRRPLPDFRDPLCKNIEYPTTLPDASVIIAFYNEAWTTLLRTVHSVLDHSPPELIKEIILIDDFSDYENLQQQLKDYLALLPKVVLRRTTSRVGVIMARQIGVSMATASVLIFLDSHCECTTGWLEPLLERIQYNSSHVVTPVMDIIDDKTFEYKSFDSKSINIGGFDWNLQFIWIGIPERIQKMQKSDIDFIKSPTMPGGMFAISKKYFNKLGGFDPGMDMWGAENLEMSFKIWMCGGTLETVPCSHVGHLFRHGTSYKLGSGSSMLKNYFRLAEVWLDDYKELYYQKTGKSVEFSEDIINRKVLRKQLQCQTFEWYLKNIYPELFIPSEALASGEIRNKEHGYADGTNFPACLDAVTGTSQSLVKIWPCHSQGGNQLWLLSKTGEIRRDDGCMDFAGEKVVILPCHGQKGNQAWEYNSDKTIRHLNSKFCMGLSNDGRALTMSKCTGESDQMWYWKRLLSTDSKVEVEEENKLLQEIALDSY